MLTPGTWMAGVMVAQPPPSHEGAQTSTAGMVKPGVSMSTAGKRRTLRVMETETCEPLMEIAPLAFARVVLNAVTVPLTDPVKPPVLEKVTETFPLIPKPEVPMLIPAPAVRLKVPSELIYPLTLTVTRPKKLSDKGLLVGITMEKLPLLIPMMSPPVRLKPNTFTFSEVTPIW